MVKPVTRHQSQEGGAGGQSSHTLSQNSTNQKLFQRIRTCKVEKNHTVTNLTAQTSSSGNKNAYAAVQSAAPRSVSQNLGNSTADTVKASEAQIPAFNANI